MSVLLMRLSGPLQSWGSSSRFNRRTTCTEPTKSGVLGLVAAALGRSREDDPSDLASLEFGVRTDQPGQLLRDFQVERSLDGKTVMPLTYRYFLADAKFLCALSGEGPLLKDVDAALRKPRWPLYLGRRSCPPDQPLSLGISEDYADVRDALSHEPWIASDWYRRGKRDDELEVNCDARPGERGYDQADVPVGFSGEGRRYASRTVVRFRVPISSLEGYRGASESHDPLSFFDGEKR